MVTCLVAPARPKAAFTQIVAGRQLDGAWNLRVRSRRGAAACRRGQAGRQRPARSVRSAPHRRPRRGGPQGPACGADRRQAAPAASLDTGAPCGVGSVLAGGGASEARFGAIKPCEKMSSPMPCAPAPRRAGGEGQRQSHDEARNRRHRRGPILRNGIIASGRGKPARMANSRHGSGSMDDGLADYLTTRRTIPASQLGDAGARRGDAPRDADHRRAGARPRQARALALHRLRPAGAREGGRRAGRDRRAASRREGAADPDAKAKGFADAPLVVAVVSAPIVDHPKIPLWEQQLSAGCVALNLIHAAAAYGFSAQMADRLVRL